MNWDVSKDYPPDTLGYHWRCCHALFGAESKATKWLEQKASESPHGMDEGVVQPESQVVFLLMQMHVKGEEPSAAREEPPLDARS